VSALTPHVHTLCARRAHALCATLGCDGTLLMPPTRTARGGPAYLSFPSPGFASRIVQMYEPSSRQTVQLVLSLTVTVTV
jgi:hypothetical protein